MKRWILFIVLPILFNFSCAASQNDTPQSGESDNGFGQIISAIGVNRQEKSITGYYRLFNPAMPGHAFHADCTIVFKGALSSRQMFEIRAKNADIPSSKAVNGQLLFDGSNIFATNGRSEQLYRLKFENNIPGCSKEIDLSNIEVQININKFGNWEKISAIQSKKAYFYSEPNDLSAGKSYLVAKDIIYVYRQNPDWYYVEFRGAKKETAGWIKKSETVTID